jgi:putative SOS response-associated peptidase YedK
MCGRFALTASPKDVAELMSLAEIEDFPARYNIAPTQPVLVVMEGERVRPGSNLPSRRALLVRWGLWPAWSKDPASLPLMINARSETAIGKASFKAAMRHRRILIPASGFYEWHRPAREAGERPQAYWVRPKRGGIVAFAGLMETWSSADGSEVDTAAILTAAANPSFAPIHERMPVVIAPEDFERWLDCKTQEPRDVLDLMRTPEEDLFEAVPVADLVNKVANTGPEIQARVETVRAPKAPPKNNPQADSGQMSLF